MILADSCSVVAALFSMLSSKSFDVIDIEFELPISDSEHSFNVDTISLNTSESVSTALANRPNIKLYFF